jgi:hypothetical protein
VRSPPPRALRGHDASSFSRATPPSFDRAAPPACPFSWLDDTVRRGVPCEARPRGLLPKLPWALSPRNGFTRELPVSSSSVSTNGLPLPRFHSRASGVLQLSIHIGIDKPSSSVGFEPRIHIKIAERTSSSEVSLESFRCQAAKYPHRDRQTFLFRGLRARGTDSLESFRCQAAPYPRTDFLFRGFTRELPVSCS